MVYNILIGESVIYIGFFILGLAVLLIASINDLKIREVPDWLSYTFLFTAVIANLILSVMENDYWIILNSLAGVLFGFILGLIFFYTGQWGGGDSKIMMGLLGLIGVNILSFYSLVIGKIDVITYILSAKWFLLIINFALAGAVYGLLFSIIVGIRKRKEYLKAIEKELKDKQFKLIRKVVFIFAVCSMLLGALLNITISGLSMGIFIGGLGLFVLVMFYVWAFAKSIDNGCMYKRVRANKATIGDWIVDKVFVNRRPKNLLAEALHEYRIRNDKKITLHSFEKRLALAYIKFTKGQCAKTFCSKSNLKDNIHQLRLLLKVSSKKRMMNNAKKLKMDKEDINKFLEFLNEQDIYFDKFLVCSMQNTGLSELQVKLLQKLYAQKKVRSVVIKEGIPFIPSFLIGFILFYVLGFWWIFLL